MNIQHTAYIAYIKEDKVRHCADLNGGAKDKMRYFFYKSVILCVIIAVWAGIWGSMESIMKQLKSKCYCGHIKMQRCGSVKMACWSGVLLLLALVLAGCGKKEEVKLTIWASTDDHEIVEKAAADFAAKNKKRATFDIKVHIENIDGVKQTVLADPDAAGDIYNFASDQFGELYLDGVLHEVTLNAADVASRCGGMTAPIVDTVSRNGRLYAYPASSSNGYFMYYNRKILSNDDVTTLDKMLDAAAAHGKKVGMDWSSGWYLYSFFKGAGMNVVMSEDGTHNICDFNRTTGNYTGVDVAEAMLDIARNPGFANVVTDVIIDEVKAGNLCAVVNGTWNSTAFQEIWGDDMAAAKLPTYTIRGEQVQMGSFAGFKYFGINAKTKYPQWAMELTEYLTDYEHQIERFETVGDAPANIEAGSSEEVKKSQAIAALGEQNKFAAVQNVLDTYWAPASVLGTFIAAGNMDNWDLQLLLDTNVEKITASK